MQNVVGIIGGMGPLATVDLMSKIISYTPARRDQDHIHIIADNYTQIPDRTTAILGKGIDPTPYIVQSAQRLQNAGAEFLVIACNTAHFYFEIVKKSVSIPILHMPLETARFVQENNFRKVGLIATDGTIKTKLYQRSCEHYGINVIEPDKEMQEKVMQGIYAIKASNLETGLLCLSRVANKMRENGVEAIIAGCTEVPLVLQSSEDIRIIDPAEVLAKMVIRIANGTDKEFQIV
ncbi:aspartate/glutamate racemase family protein [Peribacillus sp. NPDC060186]